MIGGRAFIGVDAHEELAHLGKLANECRISSDELLDGFIVTKVAEVAEDGHEPLRLERETIHIQLRNLGDIFRRAKDAFVNDLVREEVDDDVE